MFVLSQNKEILGDFSKFAIEKNICGGKEAKFALFGYTEGTASILGLYADKKLAIVKIEKILSAIENNQTVYMVE